MKLKLFFVADPLKKLNPKSDTSLAILREGLTKGHQCFWLTDSDVEYVGNRVVLKAKRVLDFRNDLLPNLGESQTLPASYFDAGFIRKDPPFNEDYVRLCWILALCEHTVFLVNKPSLVVRYHEKLLPLEAFSQGFLKSSDLIPTHLGSGPTAAAFAKTLNSEFIISKPFLGHGGKNISQWTRSKFIEKGIKKAERWEGLVVQPFLKEVLSEDRRLIFIEGKLVGQFVRVPPSGGFVANLAQGGTAEAKPLKESQIRLSEKLSRFLKKTGIFFAGVDLIGNKVSEINITSPTGFVSHQSLTGTNLSEYVIKSIERNCLRYKK
jgi:glutathione synthase